MKTYKKIIFLIILVFLTQLPERRTFATPPKLRGKLVFFTPPPIDGMTAQDILKKTEEFMKKKNYKDAREYLEEFVKRNPNTPYAPEMLYRAAICYKKEDKYKKAYKLLEKIFEKYPNVNNPDKILKTMYEIANSFAEGKRKKLLGVPLTHQYNDAIKIYQKIISHSPFGFYADDSQLQIGKLHMILGNRKKAIDAFEKLIKNYPDSELVEEALYYIALNHEKLSKKSDYDQQETEKAIKTYEKLLKQFPNGKFKAKAEQSLQTLYNKKAKELFNIGIFYYNNKKYKSAKIYFNEIIEKYPTTDWAKKTAKYLSKIETKNSEGANEN